MKQTNIAKARPGQPMGANTACGCSAPAHCPCYKAVGRPGICSCVCRSAAALNTPKLHFYRHTEAGSGHLRNRSCNFFSKSRMAVPMPHRNNKGKRNSKCRHQFLFKKILTMHRTHACVQVDLRRL